MLGSATQTEKAGHLTDRVEFSEGSNSAYANETIRTYTWGLKCLARWDETAGIQLSYPIHGGTIAKFIEALSEELSYSSISV